MNKLSWLFSQAGMMPLALALKQIPTTPGYLQYHYPFHPTLMISNSQRFLPHTYSTEKGIMGLLLQDTSWLQMEKD